ncbi:predicted protein [Nematostella vectensis]|uniref:Endonuclease/exonuclease/phosphatase domain-containing protein n=1 Tax=Nematostella vectensis TaxID=45351 RepID=A7T2B1_NEMVE|nr:predicted protein [Nematostella vectensis]|eukprot:XP_001622005.1 hypothetical protein NEMVEDRAFT_v1g221296 [Nematostella vectensis]
MSEATHDVNIAVSGLTTRSDSSDLANRVRETNRILRSFCNQKDWQFSANNNINRSHLNASGLYLNPSGTTALQRNFKSLLNNSFDESVSIGNSLSQLSNSFSCNPDPFSTAPLDTGTTILNGPKCRGFKMAFLNIVSIPNYIDEIRISHLFKSFDLLSFSETRLDSTFSDGEVRIPGYDIIRKDRNRNVGGVCLYLRSSINYCIRNDLVPDSVEAVCVEITKPHSRPFFVSIIYRPESPIDYFNDLEQLIKAVDDVNKEHVMLGDLNCCLVKRPIENKTKRLKKIYETYQLSQLLNEPTRITMHSKSLIDHFVTSCPKKINSSGVIHLGFSDHSLIYGIRKINPYKSSREKANTIEIRNMKKFNQELFARDLLAQPWEQIVLCPDANKMWDFWRDLFLNVLDKHAPVQLKKKKAFSDPWVTQELRELIIHRDKAKRKAVVSKTVV